MLTPLARSMARVHPNTITLVAMAIGVLAGLSYWLANRDPAWFFAGGALVAFSGLADALDGVVARVNRRETVWGDFLDHFCDRLVEIAILAGFSFAPRANLMLGSVVIVIVLLNAYLGTQIEASFGERSYAGLGKAELFVGLILTSVALGLDPHVSLRLAGHDWHLINLFFVIVVLLTAVAMGQRLRLAKRLAVGS